MKSKMENKESYYMNIPANVWDTDLSAKAILCYGHVTVLANKMGSVMQITNILKEY